MATVGITHGAALEIDLGPIASQVNKILGGFSEDLNRRVLYNTINHIGDKMLTRVRSDLAKQTSAPYRRIMWVVRAVKAHPNRLTYMIHAQDTAMPLQWFLKGGKPGDKQFTVKVWGKQRTFKKNVFLMDFGKGPTPVKRVAASHKKGTPLGAKVLWGPILPKEMLRPGSPTFEHIQQTARTEFIPRLQHELQQALLRDGKFIGPMPASYQKTGWYRKVYPLF